jgi:hypothetical protein
MDDNNSKIELLPGWWEDLPGSGIGLQSEPDGRIPDAPTLLLGEAPRINLGPSPKPKIAKLAKATFLSPPGQLSPPPSPFPPTRKEGIMDLRYRLREFPFKTFDPKIERDPEKGWLLPYLLEYDDAIWGRWNYWGLQMFRGSLNDDPIPQIWFESGIGGNSRVRQMIEKSLDVIPNHGRGGWKGWSSSTHFDFFLDWLLWGLGENGMKEPPREPFGCEGATSRLYQVFQMGVMQLWPADYLGDIMADMAFGKHLGFYPTPIHLCELITQMSYDEDTDYRTKTVCDPCVGTGRFLLTASNYCLQLYGMDISHTACKACKVNLALYAPC